LVPDVDLLVATATASAAAVAATTVGKAVIEPPATAVAELAPAALDSTVCAIAGSTNDVVEKTTSARDLNDIQDPFEKLKFDDKS
jgi:hypothetical protein